MMTKTFFTLLLFVFAFAQGVAQPKGLPGRLPGAGKAARAPYLKPATTVKPVTPQLQAQLAHQLAQAKQTFPKDALRHTISPQTRGGGSEKKEAFLEYPSAAQIWLSNQQSKYYRAQNRIRLQNLLNGSLVKIDALRPDDSTKNALEDYLYARSNQKDQFYYTLPLYRNVLRTEAEVKKIALPYATAVAFSVHEPRLPVQQLRYLNQALIPLINSSGKLLKLLPQDPYLQEVNSFYIELFRIFNPLLGSVIGNISLKRPDGRVFNFNEFFLHDLEGKDYVVYDDNPWSEEADEAIGSLNYLANSAEAEATQLLKNLPQNWHIAVLNDDKQPLDNFRQWAAQGRLGNAATVTTFEDGNDLLQSLKTGFHYDLIITDIYVPNGGRGMMPELRKVAPDTTVIAMSKSTRQKANVLNLFEAGMDGYLIYTSVLNNPKVGYLEYLRAINNYLQLKNLKGWAR